MLLEKATGKSGSREVRREMERKAAPIWRSVPPKAKAAKAALSVAAARRHLSR
jgi:hypothetical protein